MIKKNKTIEENIHFAIVRQKRKTVSIRVDDSDKITVFAPLKLSDDKISNMLKSHEAFLKKRINRFNALKEKFGDLNNCYFYLGEAVKKAPEEASAFYRAHPTLALSAVTKDEDVVKIYRKLTANLVRPRIAALAAQYGFTYSGVKVTKAKTRWGSCSSKNNICFSVYLSILPREAIDYVILHELTHTEHKNHGKAFWDKLALICPNYKNAEKILDDYSVILNKLP